ITTCSWLAVLSQRRTATHTTTPVSFLIGPVSVLRSIARCTSLTSTSPEAYAL
ncbi:hypothetical protein SARC_15666, partial [Sphaeroforma arctica JP610]